MSTRLYLAHPPWLCLPLLVLEPLPPAVVSQPPPANFQSSKVPLANRLPPLAPVYLPCSVLQPTSCRSREKQYWSWQDPTTYINFLRHVGKGLGLFYERATLNHPAFFTISSFPMKPDLRIGVIRREYVTNVYLGGA